MKRKYQEIISRGPSVKLYREDIDSILEILKSSCGSITVSDDNYEYDSLEEFESKKGKQPEVLKFQGSSPFVSLTFGSKTFIYAGSSKESHAVYQQIDSILRQKKVSIWTALLRRPWLILFFVIGITGFILFNETGIKVIWGIISLVAISVAFLEKHYGFVSSVNLIMKHEEKSFWVRKKDDILLAAISGLIGAALTAIVVYLLYKQGIPQ
jgi:hypothetical protein